MTGIGVPPLSEMEGEIALKDLLAEIGYGGTPMEVIVQVGLTDIIESLGASNPAGIDVEALSDALIGAGMWMQQWAEDHGASE